MVRVRFTRPVDGRCGGVQDPKPGDCATVGDSVAAALVSQGMAVPVVDSGIETATAGPDEVRGRPARRGPGRPRKN